MHNSGDTSPFSWGVFLDQRNERDARQTERDLEPHLPGPGVEEMSYIPEIAYRYGRDERGYAILLASADPGLKRREYPEVSFAVVRTIAVGLMGIEPDAPRKRVRTVSHLTKQTEWAKLENIPVFGNRISVTQVGLKKTRFFNQSGEVIEWQATFPGTHEHLFVDGRPQAAKVEQGVSGLPSAPSLCRLLPHV